MRRANAQLQSDRRAGILAAAQRCFVRSGFHGASMQEICAEAGMSPGNLYRYFPSKEALIAGIAERDGAEVGQHFASADLSHGLFTVLEGMARHYFTKWPQGTGAAVHRGDVGSAPQSRDRADFRCLRCRREGCGSKDLLRAAAERGDIPADVDFDGVITMLMIITDGLWWRRALEPDFDPEAMVPIFMDVVRHMLRARPKAVPNQDAADDNKTIKESSR